MNTSNKGYKFLGTVALTVCLLASTTTQSFAWVAWGHEGGHYHGGWGYHGWAGGPRVGVVIDPGPSYYRHPYNSCVWISGHWAHGYWVPAHRAC